MLADPELPKASPECRALRAVAGHHEHRFVLAKGFLLKEQGGGIRKAEEPLLPNQTSGEQDHDMIRCYRESLAELGRTRARTEAPGVDTVPDHPNPLGRNAFANQCAAIPLGAGDEEIRLLPHVFRSLQGAPVSL